MTRPPHAASSVVGYASDTASAVAKVELNSNRSRETGRAYGYTICISARVICAGARGCQANQWRQPGSEKLHGLAQNMWLSFLPTDFRSDTKVTIRI